GGALSVACPECGRADAPGIARRIVLPSDCRADEIALEILACPCGFKAIAVTEHARKGTLRGGAPDRVGYRLPAAAVDLLAFLISRCPSPAEEYCRCPGHAILNRRDLRNQWNLLHSFAPFPGFAVSTGGAAAAFEYAPLDWARNGDGHRAIVDGREWRLFPLRDGGAEHHELAVGDALALELDALPPFWRMKTFEQGARETGRRP